MEKGKVISITALAILLKDYPGIGNGKVYPWYITEIYKELRSEIPAEYTNAFLVRFACREFG